MHCMRDTFYNYKFVLEESGIKAVPFNQSRKTPNMKNRVALQVELAVVEYAA